MISISLFAICFSCSFISMFMEIGDRGNSNQKSIYPLHFIIVLLLRQKQKKEEQYKQRRIYRGIFISRSLICKEAAVYNLVFAARIATAAEPNRLLLNKWVSQNKSHKSPFQVVFCILWQIDSYINVCAKAWWKKNNPTSWKCSTLHVELTKQNLTVTPVKRVFGDGTLKSNVISQLLFTVLEAESLSLLRCSTILQRRELIIQQRVPHYEDLVYKRFCDMCFYYMRLFRRF